MGLFIGVTQLLANRLQFAGDRGELAANAHSARSDPGATCRSQRSNALDRFSQQLFATRLLLGQRRKATLLWAEGAKDLLDTSPIINRLFHFSLSSRATSLMARGAGELFHQCTTLFSLEAQCLVNGALTDEEETVLGESGAIEQLVEIAKANLLAIEQVLLAAAAIGATGDLDLGKWQIEESVVIGDGERYLGEAEWAALL